jgi:acyl carrier protein
LIRDFIYDAVRSACPAVPERFDPKAPWKELGIDSLIVVEIVMAIEEAFEVAFDESDLISMECVDDLVRATENRLGDDGAAGVRVPRN